MLQQQVFWKQHLCGRVWYLQMCVCGSGFNGPLCDAEECQAGSCVNNGTCVEEPNGSHCNCTDGFNGTRCENNIDDCPTVNPCLNGGTCQDGVNSYSCVCLSNYTGICCESSWGWMLQISHWHHHFHCLYFSVHFLAIWIFSDRNGVEQPVLYFPLSQKMASLWWMGLSSHRMERSVLRTVSENTWVTSVSRCCIWYELVQLSNSNIFQWELCPSDHQGNWNRLDPAAVCGPWEPELCLHHYPWCLHLSGLWWRFLHLLVLQHQLWGWGFRRDSQLHCLWHIRLLHLLHWFRCVVSVCKQEGSARCVWSFCIKIRGEVPTSILMVSSSLTAVWCTHNSSGFLWSMGQKGRISGNMLDLFSTPPLSWGVWMECVLRQWIRLRIPTHQGMELSMLQKNKQVRMLCPFGHTAPLNVCDLVLFSPCLVEQIAPSLNRPVFAWMSWPSGTGSWLSMRLSLSWTMATETKPSQQQLRQNHHHSIWDWPGILFTVMKGHWWAEQEHIFDWPRPLIAQLNLCGTHSCLFLQNQTYYPRKWIHSAWIWSPTRVCPVVVDWCQEGTFFHQ